MNSLPPAASTDPLAQRLARLTPQQRELLLRQLAARGTHSAGIIPARAEIHAQQSLGAALPLSAAQQRIWLFERLTPGSGAYHVYGHYRLRGALNVDALRRAFAEIIRRHAALRTSFSEHAGRPRQTVAAEVEFSLPVVDLAELPEAQREQAVSTRAEHETERPFDLSQPPLLRASLLRLAADQHVLLLVLHHIVSDAWSRGVLYDELAALYGAYTRGEASPLPPLAVQFHDAIHWQLQAEQVRRTEAQIGYWLDLLEGTSGVLDLPRDHPATASSGRGARHCFHLPRRLADAAADFARRENSTLFMVLLAGFQCLLARHSGQDDVVVGTPVANRSQAELAPLIGLFVNTVALRGDLRGRPGFRQLLRRTRERVLSALDHAEAPLERVVDALRLERAPGRTPLFQTMFVLQNASGGEPQLHGLSAEWIEPNVRTARFELTMSLGASADGIDGVLDFDRDLFEAATMARLATQFERLLSEALAEPDRPVDRLELLDPTQRAELLRLGDGGEPITGSESSLFALFEAQALRSPQATALLEPGRELSYRQLQMRANGLAWRLRELGLGPESRVAVLTDRSIESIVAILGVLAAGAAYVPLDPGHPQERLELLLRDAAVGALLAPPALRERARAVGTPLPVLLTVDGDPSANAPPGNPAAQHAAYVIYTSGSTGKPKGVVIDQRGALNLVRAFIARHDFVGQRLLMIPPLVFDASVGDVFPVLACGGTLVLHPTPTELGPTELEHYCREQAITAIDAPAALWRRWTEGWIATLRDTAVLPALRLMMIGGESVPLEQVRRFASVTGGRASLCNHYGPTEASVCTTLFSTRDGVEVDGLELPIGRPLPAVRVYVLDAHMQLVPRGVIGELFIGGRGVARGYFDEPALTAERFLPDPFERQQHGARMYRSGDLVRWNVDGTLQFLGRRDQQVKLRGFRIELGEVETSLAACAGVRAAAAMLREDRPGERRLVAYLVVDGEFSGARLREQLATRLPEALLPAAFVRLDALPLTVNGKIDRRALPPPAVEERAARTLRAARTDTERAVLQVWQDVLGRTDIGIDDDFFNVGGDSLSTLPLVFKLHAALGIELPLATVFAASSAQAMAQAIDDLRSGQPERQLDLAAKIVLPADIDPTRAAPPIAHGQSPRTILLTGATGFLGAFLLRDLLDTTAAEIFCLVRAESRTAGLRRVQANLDHYGLHRDGDELRLRPLLGDLALPALGLSDSEFAAVAAQAEVIFHNGGRVNFLEPYESHEQANVLGTCEVLRLATRGRLKPVHLISTLGVYLNERYLNQTVRESDVAPLADGQAGGYSQSKWVAEQLALVARQRGLPVAIYRPARITGHSRTGVTTTSDFFNAWIKGCVQLGLAPLLPGQAMDMAPVDYVSQAIVRLAQGAGDPNGVYHFFNPRVLPYTDAVAEIRAAGYAVREVDYPQWRAALLSAVAADAGNALTAFASLFPEASEAAAPIFDCSATQSALARYDIVCPPADRALLRTYLRLLQARGFLPAPLANEACA